MYCEKNGGSDPDAVWHHRSDGSGDEADSGVWGSVHRKGYFGGEFGAPNCNQWGIYGVRVRQRCDAALFPIITLGKLVIIIIRNKGTIANKINK